MSHSNYSFKSMIKKYVNSSVILIGFTVLAMILANWSLTSGWYSDLWTNKVSLSVGEFNLFSHNGHTMTLMEVINDFLMAIFFLSVGLEIKRELRVGELHDPKKALLPVIGACGGMLVPVLFFWLICPDNAEAHRGLAIPMATDIAFSLGVLALFKTRVPGGLKIFLATLAVADDLGGIIVIALFYSGSMHWGFFIAALVCLLIMVGANLLNVRVKSFYVIAGLIMWYLLLNSGVHATIAGVATAFCIPATLKKPTVHYLRRIVENVDYFRHIHTTTKEEDEDKLVALTNEEIHVWKSIESAADKMISPLQDLEDNLHNVINYFVIPLFAFANAGVVLAGMQFADLFSGVSLAIMVGLVAGKFLGVLSFSWIAVRLKMVQLPDNSNWKSFASVCMLCGIGFTVSMFIASLSYGDASAMLSQAKLGIILGSVVSALAACVLLNRTLPKETLPKE
ncbi:MAG: Na+/H+ antiporter NhaA [Bacteroidales bacterium]|nr:Na+/H+ antiporter NhaA [Bacteroidales bacterium]